MLFIIISFVLLFLIWASADIRSGIYLRCICRGNRMEKAVALTFDDGPDPVHTPRILDTLKENNIKAAFFLIGSKIETYPDLVKRIYDEGHIIGNHTYSHSGSYTLWSSDRIYEDIRKANDVIYKIIGKYPIFFRPPFGVTNPLIRRAVKNRFDCIGWSIRSYDTLKFLKRDSISERIVRNIKNGDIVLLHDNREGSGLLLKSVIEGIEKKGIKIVPLDRLINKNAYEI